MNISKELSKRLVALGMIIPGGEIIKFKKTCDMLRDESWNAALEKAMELPLIKFTLAKEQVKVLKK